MTKKIKSSFDELLESLNPEERKKFDAEFENFALSELVLALMAHDEVSARKLAGSAGISLDVIDAILSERKIP